jgi:HEAT repeat protein
MQDVFDLFCELVANLRSRSIRLRREAMAAIGMIADRTCTNVLVDAIRGETDMEVRASLIKTVGAVGTSNLVPFLEGFLRDPDARCRSNTIEALARFTDVKDRVAELIRPLVDDPDNRVCATAISVLHRLGDDTGVRLLPPMLRGPDNGRRCSAIWAIGEILHEPELSTIVEYLGSPHYAVHSISARTIRRFGSRALPALVRALDGADRFRKAYIAICLGDVGDPAAAGTLRALLSDPDEMVRLHVVSALGRLAEPSTFPDLVAQLAADSPVVRVEALAALRRIGDRTAAPAIQDLLARETSARVLASAASTLGALGSGEAAASLKPLLTHSDARVRANAVEALGRIGDARIVAAIRPFLDDPDNRVFANTAVALYEFGDVKVVDLLAERMRSGSEPVRMSVAYALGEIPLEQVIEPLVNAVADQSAQVRRRIVASLLKKGTGARAALEKVLADDAGFLDRPGAPSALGLLGVRQALTPLLARFFGPGRRPVSRVAEAAADGEAARQRIAALFDQLRDRVRSSQIELTRRVRGVDPDLMAGLRDLMASDDPRLRCFAVFTLGELKSRDALGTILCLLHDPDDGVRCYAADALAKIGDWRAVRFLELGLADLDPDVRRHMVRALGELGGPSTVAILDRLRGTGGAALDRDVDGAAAAIQARSSTGAEGAGTRPSGAPGLPPS